ncbi:hypothetical protein DPMN_153459 [Dreissena polymorpha]|uniref:Uncharacterized protein n=1 Tax=Dreissena polymorpha TaxID=45954 RepID=A0A9D4FK71_DREPO|nr:hypothetical protein DPMN_153459 [Dreissena polymorpha]
MSLEQFRNVSEREERMQRRNIEKEMEEIRHGRQYIQERNRTRLNASVHECESPLRTQERITSSSRQQRVSFYVPLHEGENLEDVDIFLKEARMEQRERINSLGSNVGDLVTVDEYVYDTEQTKNKTLNRASLHHNRRRKQTADTGVPHTLSVTGKKMYTQKGN